jgi:hypothetical protein
MAGHRRHVDRRGLLITGLLLQRRAGGAGLSLPNGWLGRALSARLITFPERVGFEIKRHFSRSRGSHRSGLSTTSFPASCIAWAAAGIEPPLRISEPDQFPWTASQLERGQVVRFSRLDELPVEAAVDRRGYQSMGTRSYLSLPLSAGGPVLGVLSFDVVRGERSGEELRSGPASESRQRPERADLALAVTTSSRHLAGVLAFSSRSAACRSRDRAGVAPDRRTSG